MELNWINYLHWQNRYSIVASIFISPETESEHFHVTRWADDFFYQVFIIRKSLSFSIPNSFRMNYDFSLVMVDESWMCVKKTINFLRWKIKFWWIIMVPFFLIPAKRETNYRWILYISWNVIFFVRFFILFCYELFFLSSKFPG